MKTAETKTASSPHLHQAGKPFFQKGGESAFFSDSQTDLQTKPFFSKQTAQPFIQTKLTIGQPGDKYEQEADSMAEQVVQRLSQPEGLKGRAAEGKSSALSAIQLKCATCEQEEKLQKKEAATELEEPLQRKPVFESNAEPDEEVQRKCAACEAEDKLQRKQESSAEATASPTLESGLADSRGTGSPLPDTTRQQMESSFGADFGRVRIHSGNKAWQLSQDLEAQAFTRGSDIYFDQGKYNPGSQAGQQLLAHELTHVVQQDSAKAGGKHLQRVPDIQRDDPEPRSSETKDEFSARVHEHAANRLTQNIATLRQWSNYVSSMEGFQLRAQLLTGVVSELAATASPTPSGRQRFETFAGTPNRAERDFQGAMLNIDATYRERSGNFMAFLDSKAVGGYYTSPSVAQQMQVLAGDRQPNTLPGTEYVPPDPRYSAYAPAIRNFQTGESGGCQTCHDINAAWQRTTEIWGSPLPQGDIRSAFGFDISTGSRLSLPYQQLSAEDEQALANYAQGLNTGAGVQPTASPTVPAATPAQSTPAGGSAGGDGPNPFLPQTALPTGVPIPPARTNLCGALPDTEESQRIPMLSSWGENSANVARVIGRIDAVLRPLGPRGYRVLGRQTFDELYSVTPDNMEQLRAEIIRKIRERQQQYAGFRTEIRSGEVPYEELCPIVDELLPSTNQLVRALVMQDVRRWQDRENLLLALELTLIGLSLLMPPVAFVAVPMGIGLGMARVGLGFDQMRQGRQWQQGSGTGLYAPAQEAEAPGLESRGQMNIFGGLLGMGISGVSTYRMTRTMMEAVESIHLLRSLQTGAVISHPDFPGQYLLSKAGKLLLVDDMGQVLGYGAFSNGRIWFTRLPSPIPYPGAAGATAEAGAAGTAMVPFGTQGMAPFGGSPLMFPGATATSSGFGMPQLPGAVPALGNSMAPLGQLGAGAAQPPLLLTAPHYVDFADLDPFMRQEFGAAAGSGVSWSVSPQGTAFVTPPFRGLPMYAPDGLLPPGQFYTGIGSGRAPMLAGPLREGFSPFDVLPGARATSRTLPQVRNMTGGNKVRGNAGELYIAEQSGGIREVRYTLPGDLTRDTDVVTPSLGGELGQEVKNYMRYSGGSGPVAREVPLTPFLRTEVTRDAMIMHYYPGHQPVWVFVDAPPSAELVDALRQAGIPYTVMSDRLPFQ